MNIFSPFLFISVIGAIILFGVSFWGDKKGYYKKGRENFWFDKIMHFFGGFFTAMFWSGLLSDAGYPSIILLTFLVGVFWEIGEYFYGVYKLKKLGTKEYMTEIGDTIEDLVCDTFGAVVLLFLIESLLSYL